MLLEANILAKLKHPGIAGVRAIIAEPLGVVLEWVYGLSSLRDALDKNGRLTVIEVINYGIKLANTLGYLKEQSFVHRNIKPDNIMLTENGEAILINFFVARSNMRQNELIWLSDGTYGYVGTRRYSAPEQLSTPENAGPPTDVFALGVVLYESLTGTFPYEYGNLPELYGGNRFPKPKQFDIPEPLYSILYSLFSDNPDQRPSAAQLQEDLMTCLNLLEAEQKDIEVKG